MKLIVNAHKIELVQEQAVNEKEIDISKCEFEFAEEITNDYVKEAYFTLGDKTYKQVIVNNECSFPQEVLVRPATIELGVVAYLVEDDEEIKRYNPTPVYFKTDLGSLKNAQNSQPITPSEMEQYEQALQDGLSEVNDKLEAMGTALAEVDNLDIDASKSGTVSTVTITNKAGTTKSVQILDGVNGTNGKDGVDGKDGKDGKDGTNGTNGTDGISPIATITKSGSTATITITDKNGTTTATVSDGTNGTNGTNGRDGYVQYTAGTNISIEDNVISAIGGGIETLENQTIQLKSANVTSNITAGLYILKGASTVIKYANNLSHSPLTYCGDDGQAILLVSDVGLSSDSGIYSQIGYVFISSANANEPRIYVYNRTEMSTFKPSRAMLTDTICTVSQTHTYTALPVTSITPTENTHIVNKKYVDDSITSAITTTLGGNY